jgi:hypothetical protein
VESWRAEDKAALRMEFVKRQHYSKVALPARLPVNSVYPFVVEASGPLGPCALSLLNRICGTHTFLRSSFLKDVALITWVVSWVFIFRITLYRSLRLTGTYNLS